MNIVNSDLLSEVAGYYSSKLAEHGATPRGVDWNGEESQIIRFQQLSKIFDVSNPPMSVNDLGCGYGSMLKHLVANFTMASYLGLDVSQEMILAAKQLYKETDNIRFIAASVPDRIADYGVASGIFNVRLHHSDAEWIAYIKSTLDILNATSSRGFSFNCLTSYSDNTKKRDHLYYADPCIIFDYCKRRYARDIALLHDYNLYEFTILVRKES